MRTKSQVVSQYMEISVQSRERLYWIIYAPDKSINIVYTQREREREPVKLIIHTESAYKSKQNVLRLHHYKTST